MDREVIDSKGSPLALGIVFFSALLPILLIQIFHSSLYFESEIPPYLLFHNIAELFSVIVSMSIFGVGWFTYTQSRDRHTLFLGTCFLGIGFIDLMHMLGYSGMPDFLTPNSPNKSTQFWIVVRFFSAFSFLASAFIDNRKGSGAYGRAFVIFPIFVSAFAFVSVNLFPQILPATYLPEVGLTQFKKVSEYVIIIFLILSFIAYAFRIPKYGWASTKNYLYAFIFCIFSETVFAIYSTVFDVYNVIGHLYKIIAFCLIYRGVFISSVNKPYEKILETNERLRVEIHEHEKARNDLTRSLTEKEGLVREVYHRSNNNLQVVGSLISLQAERHPENSELRLLVDRTQDRIQAISLVHRLLFAEKDLSSVSARQYISELSSYVLQKKEEKLTYVSLDMEVEDKRILMDVAIPVGLILSELLSNTLQHAFTAPDSIRIQILFFQRDEDRFVLKYTDNGIGLPKDYDFKKNDSFGMQLIRGIAESQLSGKLSLLSGPGFHCEIDFPKQIYRKRV